MALVDAILLYLARREAEVPPRLGEGDRLDELRRMREWIETNNSAECPHICYATRECRHLCAQVGRHAKCRCVDHSLEGV